MTATTRRGFLGVLTAAVAGLGAVSCPVRASTPTEPAKDRRGHYKAPPDLALTAYVRSQLGRGFVVYRWGAPIHDPSHPVAITAGEVIEARYVHRGDVLAARVYLSGLTLRDAYSPDGLRRTAALAAAADIGRTYADRLRPRNASFETWVRGEGMSWSTVWSE